ncbi:MBL fold metallo-hydrolase [Nocardioides daejeonensis]|uniref:MBL fold metallo-hydrolase n=1 Tax=Nocardioides daejeonensis TaxID=1046556 RepID=UPI000D7484B9|nr:MBL fold metallo-hydrolase [Nocardioides daejeonensis]
MSELDVTWWGHASSTVTIADVRIALDPVFPRQLAHLRRRVAVPPSEAATADLVLISHLHSDHLHLPTLRRFPPATELVVPRGAAPLLRGLPHRVTEIGDGELLVRRGVTVEALPAHHPSHRFPGSRLHAPPLGFRLSGAGRSVWFPGDTGLFDGLEAVVPVDLALVPIGGWGPSLGEHHLDPLQAVEALHRVGAQWTVPVHWGSYWPLGLEAARRTRQRLFVEPPHRFADELRRRLPTVRLDVPSPGESLRSD